MTTATGPLPTIRVIELASYISAPYANGRVRRQLTDVEHEPMRNLMHSPVDADGVAAEWVEATVARPAQPTLVTFLGNGYGADPLEQARPSTGLLAIMTGARVLSVACQRGVDSSRWSMVERGLTAYRWLLGEGCDLQTTALTSIPTDLSLVKAIIQAADCRGLPFPAAGILVGSILETAVLEHRNVERSRG
jgi:hypothetical protein